MAIIRMGGRRYDATATESALWTLYDTNNYHVVGGEFESKERHIRFILASEYLGLHQDQALEYYGRSYESQ